MAREAEVEDLDAAVPRHEHVVGLQVAVDDALGVRGGETERHLRRVVGRLAERERPVAQPLAQRLALEQLRHDVRDIALAADVVERQDVGMAERRHGARLALEALAALGALAEVRRQHLDRHVATEPGVARAVDLAHPSRTERGRDLVGPEAGPGGQGHGAAVYIRATADLPASA